MDRKTYIIYSLATGLLKGAALAAIVLWLLPSWGVNIPSWGLVLILVGLVVYEVVTSRAGWKALKRKPAASPRAIVGCYGKATTPLTPHGYVRVQGELWHALSRDTSISEGDDIVVVEVNRLVLHVAPVAGNNEGVFREDRLRA
jgi:membrane-bound ClpP family serine protease